jgi:hypothetical protein
MGKGTEVTLGYKYYLGMHMIICHGPVESINRIYVGERLARSSPISYDGVENPIKSFLMSAPGLFGGLAQGKEGGVEGPVDIMFGADDQTQSDYLLTQDGMTASNLPAFRGVVSCVLKGTYVAAYSPYLKPWAFTVRRIPGKSWYSAKATINISGDDASANGAHILYEVLTNADWGLGYSAALIDDASFRAAADTLYDEEFGLSLVLTGQEPIEEFVQQILRHINGVVYTDRTTGKFTLVLIRDDYSVPALPVFNESNVIKLDSFQRSSYAELINEVTIVYRERGFSKDSAATFQDLASIQAQGGIIAQIIQFPGIDNRAIAEKVGMRELRQHSTPLAQMRLVVNRQGWDINPGDPIVLEWPTLGIASMVVRVVKADYGDVRDGKIQLDCVEDIFGLPTASYYTAAETGWVDPVGAAAPVTTAKLSEATYYEIATGFPGGQVAIQNLTAATSFLVFLADQPVVSPSYQLWAKTATGDYQYRIDGSYTPNVTLSNDIYYTDEVDIATSIMPFEAQFVQVGSYGFINDEIVRIDAIDTDNNLVTLGRGCIDTIPAQHSAGDTLWFGKGLWGIDFSPFGAETIYAKALVQTGSELLDIGSATEETTTLVGRQYKPYPVANVTHGDSDWSFPQQTYGIISGSPGIRFKWADRNRLQQTVPGIIADWFDSTITVESGVTYSLSLYGEMDLYRSASRVVDPAGGNLYDWTTEVADSGLSIYDPVGFENPSATKHPDIACCLANTSRYKSGVSGVVDSSTNITYTNGFAHFDGTSYIEVSNDIASTGWTMLSLIFNPTAEGDDEQVILGIYGDLVPVPTPTEFGPLLVISWLKATNALVVRVDADYLVRTGVVGYARPGVNNELFVFFEEPIYAGGDAPGSPSIRSGSIDVTMNDQTVTTRGSSWGLLGASKPWTLGCGWESNASTRTNFFRGSMTDFRLWRPAASSTITTSDIWDSARERANRSYRVKIETERDVASLQTYDFTVPYRAGWGLNWGNDWGGRF